MSVSVVHHHNNRMRLTVDGEPIALPPDKSVTLDLNLHVFSSHELRSLVAKGCEVLRVRDELPPEGIIYQPRVSPTLLTLPRETRDQIYKLCGLSLASESSKEPNNHSILHMTKHGLEAVPASAGRNP